MGLLDSIPGMGFDASSTGTAGLLTNQDKLMALFSGLTNAGVMMAQPGLGKGQALAMGLGGLGHGIQQGNQMALQQRLVEQRLAEQQRKQLEQERFATMLAGGANGPRTDGGNANGMDETQRAQLAALARIDPGAAAKIWGANIGKAPETVEGFDPTSGQPTRYMFNRQSGKFDQPVGGSKVNPMEPVRQPDGTFRFLPGVIPSLAQKEGALKGASAAAEAQYKAYPVAPGGSLVTPFAGAGPRAGGAPGVPGVPGAPMAPPTPQGGALPPGVAYQDPRPAPGSQAGHIENYMAERFVETQKGAIDARNKNASLDRLGTFLDQAYTGTGADTVLAAQKAAKALGFDLGNPAPAEAGRALAGEMALQLRNPSGGAGMPGAMSDKDREFLQSMTPGLGMTPEGRAVLVDALRRVNKRNEDIGAFARQYARDHGNKLDLNFEDEVSRKFGSTDMFGDLAQKMPGQPAGSTPPAEQSKVIGGKTYVKRNGQWFEQ